MVFNTDNARSLPDRLINAGEYEPVPQIAHECTVAAEPKRDNDHESLNEDPKFLFTLIYSSLI